MFFHILTIQRQVNWIFCNVGFAETPLAGIDSINNTDGSCDENSALSIVVFGVNIVSMTICLEREEGREFPYIIMRRRKKKKEKTNSIAAIQASSEHLQMLDGLLAQLLTIKWTTAARNRFKLWLGQFCLFILLSMIAYCSRFSNRGGRISSATNKTDNQSTIFAGRPRSAPINWENCSEIALIVFVIYYLWVIMSRIVPNFWSKNSIVRLMSQAPEISLFSLTCVLILLCIPLRLLGLREAEDVVASLVMFSLPLKFLFFCRTSKSVGPFVVVIYKIVANDVLCFVVLLVIFVGGFSQCKCHH